MQDVFVLGVGLTPINRDSAASGRDMAVAAVRAAIADAVLEPDRLGALYVGNMTAGVLDQQQQLGGLLADYAGLSGIEAIGIEAACASGGAAFRMGCLAVSAGLSEAVVVCGLERMTHADRDSVTRALAAATDWELEGRHGETFLSLNAGLMRAYMDAYGVSAEGFAPFAINAHANASTNPNAVFQKRIELEDYLESRIVIDPLRLYDVSPVCNGSAAIVLGSRAMAEAAAQRGRGVVQVAASSVATAPVALSRRQDILHFGAVAASTQRALTDARVAHADIDLFELHDAYTVITALSLEAAGFTPRGTATQFAKEGRVGLEGDLPIATMGGLKARGHPIGATGLYQLAECHLQLTGKAGPNQIPSAEVALAQNIGGTASTVVTHVLRRTA